ncbi:MAG: tetratricopeptide repeat protein [Bryobacteraceae bacterium]
MGIATALFAGLWCQERGQLSEDPVAQAEILIGQEEFAKAEEALMAVRRQQPGNTEALYRLGYVQFRQRKLAAAKQSFSAVVAAAPPAYFSRYFLGRISLLEGNAAEAIRWLEPLASSKKPVFDAGVQLSGAYAQMGQLPKAASTLQAAIPLSPWDGALYFRLGQLQQRMGQAGMARESFAASNRLKSANREDVERLMEVSAALRKGEITNALAAARGVEARQPADPGALVALGLLYGNSGLDPHALGAFEAAVRLEPKLFDAQLNRGLAHLKQGNLPAAIEALTVALKLLPQSVETNRALGLALVMSQRYADAQAPLERAFRADPAQQRLGLMLATAYLRTGASGKALPLLRSLTAHPSGDPTALLLLIDALTASEDFDGALETARLARRRFPNAAEPAMAEAQQLVRLGQYRKALPLWELALQLKPGTMEAELGLADCLQKAGEHDKALAHYRLAARGRETVLAAKVGMARSLVALKAFEEARVVLEEALSGNPKSIPLRQELSRVYARLGKSELAAEQARLVDQLRTANTP